MSIVLSELKIGSVITMRGAEAQFGAFNWELFDRDEDATDTEASLEMIYLSVAGYDFKVDDIVDEDGEVRVYLKSTKDQDDFNITPDELKFFSVA